MIRLRGRRGSPGARAEPTGRSARPIVVLQSFPEPRETTNPYIVMLKRALEQTPGLRIETFRWRRAIFGRYDVFHLHWPEILVTGRTPARSALRCALASALVVRLSFSRAAVVRTVHNLRPPRTQAAAQRLLLVALEARTTLRVRINEATPSPAGHPTVTIPHGHYRDWFAAYPIPSPVPGRIVYFGLVRHYKNVGALAEAFRRAPGSLTLRIGGRPSDEGLRQDLTRVAAADPRISLTLRHLTDEELVELVGEAELVVLPYLEMHNSGSVLTALSLGRPVLVPANASNNRLAAEVGMGWVHQYAGAFDTTKLLAAHTAVRHGPLLSPPDLSGRGWDDVGDAHSLAYRQAIEHRHARRPYSA